ncbi:hypothetical protein ABPG77_002470 [Micractinium sp. CCAP 211/92]
MFLNFVALVLVLAARLRAERTGPGVCHPDCTKHGNCNSDTGECICRYGWVGKACEVDALSACRLEPDGPATCGWHKTMNCHCFRQCKQFHCRDGVGCARSLPPDDRGCYIQDGVPLEQQRSITPDAGQPGFKFFKGWQVDAPEAQGSEAAVAMAYGDFTTVGLSNCPKSCNNRGLCTRLAKKADAPASCMCMRGYKGPSCEQDDSSCVLGCSGRGTCVDKFFCHCQPPFFGHGCVRDGSVSPAPSRPNPLQLKIFLYELPTHLAYPVEEQLAEPREEEGGSGLYAAYMLFMEQFLTSNVRTSSPESANLFFVEPYTYSVTKMVWDGNEVLANVLGHIKSMYPFWNRTQGRDHFLWAPQDRGGCHLTGLALQPIKITHFGMHTSDVQKAKPLTVRQRGAKGYGCYHPMRDIVAVTRDNKHRLWAARSNEMSMDDIMKRKTKLLFWNGGSLADHTTPEAVAATAEFSGSSRQILDRLDRQWKDPEINLVVLERGAHLLGPEELEDAYRSARFCFAPYGWGFGNRLAQAVVCNCIPVVVQEQVFQAYEDLLPYESFSVRLTNQDLPMLREILRNISDAQYWRMMEHLIKFRPAFNWFPESGGRAFDFTIASLRRRHQNMKALLY